MLEIKATPINIGQAISHERIARSYLEDWVRCGSPKALATARYHAAKAQDLRAGPAVWTLS